MLALIGQTDKTIAVPRKTNDTTEDISSSCLPPGIREEKVRNIRRQLAEGGYDLDKRMTLAADKLCKKLVKLET